MKITNRGRRAGVCLAALVPLSLWAAGAQDAPKISDATKRSRFTADHVAEDMQGMWRLEKVQDPERGVPDVPEKGYMLVSGSYFAMEIHGDWMAERARIVDVREPTKTEDVVTGVMQTGMHSFVIGADSTMTATSMIGTAYLGYGAYEFEAPGTEREYRVEIVADVMHLTSFDGRRLSFRRMSRGVEQRDIYGRLRKPEPRTDGEGEIEYEVGADGEVKRDIFGRPVRKKPGDEQ